MLQNLGVFTGRYRRRRPLPRRPQWHRRGTALGHLNVSPLLQPHYPQQINTAPIGACPVLVSPRLGSGLALLLVNVVSHFGGRVVARARDE